MAAAAAKPAVNLSERAAGCPPPSRFIAAAESVLLFKAIFLPQNQSSSLKLRFVFFGIKTHFLSYLWTDLAETLLVS